MKTNINIHRIMQDTFIQLQENMTDEDALNALGLFDTWAIETDYKVGDRIRYEEVLYKCVQSHTSQSDWTPDVTPALWVRVSIDEFPEWKQPTGAQDAYRIGDKVSHLDKHWISTLDYNVYEPSVYGWDEI